jgi:hypothetical protein
MIHERSFVRRGRQVCLRELTDWVGLRQPDPETERAGSKSAHSPSRRSARSIHRFELAAPEIPQSQIRAFEDAGWNFVPRSSAIAPGPNIRQANVYIEPSGRLVLCANTLTVQFRDEISKTKADEFLEGYGCRVLEKLTFAPGLFRVALTALAQGDALDVAEGLQRSDYVKSAEPELIEQIGAR